MQIRDENGKQHVTNLHWDNAARKFSYTGPRAWTRPEAELIEVIGR
jgi:hypothetical protein